MSQQKIRVSRLLSNNIVTVFLGGLLLLQGACGGGGTVGVHSPTDHAVKSFREGAIIETATGDVVSLDQLIARLLQQEIVYLGEEHHNRFHIEAALTVLQHLMADARRPVLAMEMFGWDGQPAIDRFLSFPEMSRQDFLEQVRWQQNWGGVFEDYEPLVQYAKIQRLPLIAMNPPKTLVKIVAKQGLEQARRSPEMVQWHMQNEAIVDDQAYRARIIHQLRTCHDGGTDSIYQTMYEASMVRDEGMAKIIVAQVERLRAGSSGAAGPVVSYTGGGHIQYNLPVPKRVARRLPDPIRHVSIYMTSYEKERTDEIRDMIRENISDYVWLTPVSAQGPPRRCR